MVTKRASIDQGTTDIDVLELARSKCSEFCSEAGYTSTITWIKPETKQALLDLRDRLDDAMADLDHDIAQLKAADETEEFYSQERSLRMDLCQAIGSR